MINIEVEKFLFITFVLNNINPTLTCILKITKPEEQIYKKILFLNVATK